MPVPPRRLCRVVASLELPLALVLAPVLLFPTPRRLLACLVIPVVLACARRATGRTLPLTPFDWPIALIAAMTLVSLAVTFDPQFSLGKICGVALGVLVFYACVRRIDSVERLWDATLVFIALGAGLAVVGLLGTAWVSKFPLLDTLTGWLPPAIRGVAGAEEGFHPNPVAGALLLFLPVQAGALAAAATRGPLAPQWHPAVRTLAIAATLLTAVTLLLTQSRGAWAGLAVAVWVALLVRGHHRGAIAVGSAAVAVAALVAVGPTRAFDQWLFEPTPELRGRIGGRADVWRLGLEAAADAPLTGTGMNTFRRLMPLAYPSVYAEPGSDVAHAHNQLLQTVLDLGLAGLVGYVSLLLLTGVMLAFTYRHGPEAMRPLALSLGVALLAHSIFGIADAIPLGSKVGIVFWLYLAMVAGLHRVSTVLAQTATRPAVPAAAQTR